jgi:hypothetical protein
MRVQGFIEAAEAAAAFADDKTKYCFVVPSDPRSQSHSSLDATVILQSPFG